MGQFTTSTDMSILTILTSVLFLFSTLSQARCPKRFVLNSLTYYEQTGDEQALSAALSVGVAVEPQLIQDLATTDLLDHPEGLDRRLRVLNLLIQCGYSPRFPTLSLADCMDVQILSFLLTRGASSAGGDDLYQALLNGDFEYANLFLEQYRGQIHFSDLQDLLAQSDNPELSEWIRENVNDLQIIY